MNEPARDMRLLRELADGCLHSDQQLSETLSVTQAAVARRIAALERLGVSVLREEGGGYRLARGIELLSEAGIREQLDEATARKLVSLDVHLFTDSTNQRLLESPPPPAGKVRACLAEYQSAGRGRRGSRWQAPFASGVCLSVSRVIAQPSDACSTLSLVAGVAVTRALALCGLPDACLKWPNDVVCRERKLAGILVEMRGEARGPATVVIGVGLNYSLDNDARRRIADTAALPPTDILEQVAGDAPGRDRLAAALIGQLLGALNEFDARGFAAFADDWRGKDALLGRTVSLTSDGGRVTGVARGVDDSGALLLEADNRLQRFVSGEANLLRTESSGKR